MVKKKEKLIRSYELNILLTRKNVPVVSRNLRPLRPTLVSFLFKFIIEKLLLT